MVILALSIAPGLAVCIYVFWKDKFEKEPLHLLLKSFALGICSALIAIAGSLTFEQLHVPTLFLKVFIGIALVEEFSKFIFLRWYTFPKKEFNEPYDGITYSVMISMGFATIENVLYVLEGGIATAMMRMFTAVPAHAVFAVIMGYYSGLAKVKPERAAFYHLLGLFAAAALHGTYDYCLLQTDYPLMFVGALVSLIAGIYYSLKAIKLHQHNSPFKPSAGADE